MKNLNAFLFGALAIGALTLTSCSKDNNEPIITGFLITDDNGGDIEAGDVLTISADFTDAEGLGEARLSIETNGNSVGTVTTTELSKTSAAYSETFTVPSTASNGQVYEIKLTVEDDNKDLPLTDFVSESITVGDLNAAGSIETYTSKVLEDANDASASTKNNMISLSTGVIYNKTSGQANPSSVDLVYYHGASNGHTFAAPNDATVNMSTASTFGFTENFSTQNATTFAMTTWTAADFDAITDDSFVDAAEFPTTTDSKENMVANGNIIAFTTASGKKGLIKVVGAVDSTTGTQDGTCTFSIKVQQ